MVTPTLSSYARQVDYSGEIIMENIALIGIDIGKHSFHIHCQDSTGKALLRKKLSRLKLIEFLSNLPICTIVMEACNGAHYLARKLQSYGHQVKLISPQFVRPFVKTNKNDFIDAEAICEAASRPSMRFVSPKTETQQTLAVLHRIRESLVKDKVKTTNQIHAFLLEFGISLPRGEAIIKRLSSVLAENGLPHYLTQLVIRLHHHYLYLMEQIKEVDTLLQEQLKQDEIGQRLLTIPSIGPITASLLTSLLGDGKHYSKSRDFAASTGLVPRQYSTGGRTTLYGISKRGNKNLRRLLVQCARVYMQQLAYQTGKLADWVKEQLKRKHSNVVACGLANKLARIVWAITTKQTVFNVNY